MDKCIITASSNRFFPSILNLIGSIKNNYPNHPKIYVYSIELLPIFKKELKKIENLELIETPEFCSFWKKCYTWKPYILNQPLAELNLFLDAGNQVLRPLDEMFAQIEKNEYFVVSQNTKLHDIIPQEYGFIFNIKNSQEEQPCFASGIFGFKKSSEVLKTILQELYESALCGLCLGFSPKEQERNVGKNKTIFIRNCKIFRHEQTILNILFKKYLGDYIINPIEKYAGWQSPNEHPEQLIWNLRRNYTKLDYANSVFKKHKKIKKIILNLFFIILTFKRKIKNLLKKHV
ncbi:MAG: hypothetical protein WC523_01010 [Patescibacteria group bacterium]|jgi:hypothetical protein